MSVGFSNIFHTNVIEIASAANNMAVQSRFASRHGSKPSGKTSKNPVGGFRMTTADPFEVPVDCSNARIV
jgi:hypothetical protein